MIGTGGVMSVSLVFVCMCKTIEWKTPGSKHRLPNYEVHYILCGSLLKSSEN